MKAASSQGATPVQAILGDAFRVLEFEQSTHTSAEAAAAVGCDVAQIAKSMLFKAADGNPVLMVTSGANRMDEKKVAALLGQKISREASIACHNWLVSGVEQPWGTCRVGSVVEFRRDAA